MAQALQILSGVSSVLGLLAVVAYFYFQAQRRKTAVSVRSAIEGDRPLTPDDLAAFLAQFPDADSRLIALKEILHHDDRKAGRVLDKINNNIDVQHVINATTNSQLRTILIGGVFFFLIGVLGVIYGWHPVTSLASSGETSPPPSSNVSSAPAPSTDVAGNSTRGASESATNASSNQKTIPLRQNVSSRDHNVSSLREKKAPSNDSEAAKSYLIKISTFSFPDNTKNSLTVEDGKIESSFSHDCDPKQTCDIKHFLLRYSASISQLDANTVTFKDMKNGTIQVYIKCKNNLYCTKGYGSVNGNQKHQNQNTIGINSKIPNDSSLNSTESRITKTIKILFGANPKH